MKLAIVFRGALLAVLVSAVAAPAAQAAEPGPLVWEQWQRLVGVVDIGGVRSDGMLVAMAAGRLYLVSPDGEIAPFAAGPGGYAGPADAEPYLVVAPSLQALPASAA